MRRRALVLVSLVSVFLLVASVAAGGCQTKKEAEVIKLGWVAPFSGNYAWAGKYLTDGSKVAIEEINAAGGILGRKLVLLSEDDEGDPTKSVNAAIKLIEKDKIDVLMGPFNSSCALAVMKVAEQREVPMVTWALTPLLTTQGNKWVFRLSPSDAVSVKSIIDYALDQKGYKRIAFLTDSTDYGTGGYIVGEQVLKQRGLAPLCNEKFNIPDKDFTAQLLRIKALNPDALFLHGDEGDIGIIARQRIQLGMGNLQIIGGVPLTGKKFIEMAGAEAAEGTIVATNFLASNPDPKIQEFVQKFQKMHGYVPEARGAGGYDGTWVAALGIKNAGKLDKTAIRDGIRAVQGYEGVQGVFNYDETGEGLKSCIKAIFRNGEMVFLAK